MDMEYLENNEHYENGENLETQEPPLQPQQEMVFKLDLSAKNTNADIVQKLNQKPMSIEALLIFATETDCSDLRIKINEKPYITRFGNVIQVPCLAISDDNWYKFYHNYILKEYNAQYVREKKYDTSIEIRVPETSESYKKGILFYRYRACFSYSGGSMLVTFRMIRPETRTFENINFSKQCENALRVAYSKPTGIVLFTGPTGSGKSTTLTACMNTFTQPGGCLDNKVILSLEDPIENLFVSTPTVNINQKELSKDFLSYEDGIKTALREHPNMIIVGEMRDRPVICAAIEAGRTGHLVSSTFHAADVAGTLSRILYHLDNDPNLRFDLIIQLNIIMSQRMLKRDDKYVVDTQYLLFDKQVTEYLLKRLQEPNSNVNIIVNELIRNPKLQELQMAKDWEYPNEVGADYAELLNNLK